ncbi:MAG TPA: DUF4864 domain-containing protein [Ramlibacter sp.]|nr:DUF4864 domain-containing protein [Ramlibacter sp.]
MNPIFKRLLMLVALALASWALPLQAEPLADADATKVRDVIVAQLAALAEDDADGAFATATPAVREAIGSSGRFLAMVRGAYPMVYRAASVSFLKPEAEDDNVMQLVQIVDTQSKSWLALFTLERQPDSSWRISGCVVSESRWQSI